ncbi:MAG: hypothetical protein M3357_14370, partial [Actinomycetota bacterium]|nr:hypothetical protein [Actinomycetota bacterium]
MRRRRPLGGAPLSCPGRWHVGPATLLAGGSDRLTTGRARLARLAFGDGPVRVDAVGVLDAACHLASGRRVGRTGATHGPVVGRLVRAGLDGHVHLLARPAPERTPASRRAIRRFLRSAGKPAEDGQDTSDGGQCERRRAHDGFWKPAGEK